ncbi:MBL fold metallo-hydrolase [Pseudodesulfovibrio piezophilus]|uniref:Beta-lactamase domain protein n=1 Tax=Pseudodesulfovibrio piezophilus (strain DSM 21447 / JCM 15486 / C1TLV30) TaxID=1322246 RepID=M1WPR3_PSEP2|nr:MBL fold metallo-hydrolase [Pseudodesulfovibrio piezophilus]CCH48534.1 Beta-lactamase domain protein [Pseudodesulfovibrio piezophilus C1TLV30]
MEIKNFPLGPLQTNCYLLYDDSEALVIDPGGDPTQLTDFVKEHALTITHILNTHLHFDHTYGNKVLSERTGAPILCGEHDLPLLENELGRGGTFGLPEVEPYEAEIIEPGEHTFGNFSCTVFHTPGHSAGSLTFHFPDAQAAFVGDLIFYRSIGRTDFPGGDLEVLKNSVKEYIFTLPPETLLLSGHGPETSVADEMHHNPFFGGY